jgi:hypothetical protein
MTVGELIAMLKADYSKEDCTDDGWDTVREVLSEILVAAHDYYDGFDPYSPWSRAMAIARAVIGGFKNDADVRRLIIDIGGLADEILDWPRHLTPDTRDRLEAIEAAADIPEVPDDATAPEVAAAE